ncbi:MAG: NAD(P)(+) transhydrogenase (Re/Si-specific) subunit beta [Myxococcales bacterium]|nr:NAD(P)(+) transhydrogenase (Re/Si-specific) subunit beta [Myxococcales bacterium]
MSHPLILFCYLVAAVLFIVGLKRLSSPKSAASGNLVAAVGMLLAIAATLLDREIVSFTGLIVAMAIGSAIGAATAYTVKMTAMPQMVAVFNGFGGGASALVASAELLRRLGAGEPPEVAVAIPIVLGVLIGSITFTGSLVAFAKLQDLMTGQPIVFPLQQVLNALLALALVAAAALLVLDPADLNPFWVVVGISLALGILLVVPIGGADMPVVISLLNSYSGLAACATGFALENHGLIIAGSLVGASGLILTMIMCRAMNRSLANVMFGAFGQAGGAGGAAAVAATGTVKSGTAEEAAMILEAARSVVVVPGYGLAVAQAQHAVRRLCDQLSDRGIDVKYAIHPVAGRMPGHMNVLLAEADVPYEQLVEMDEINPQLPNTDVALVIGANDVTNPDARENSNSPIYGMPIIEVDHCKTVIVCKRSMNPGFAGIDNPLFTLDNTMMYFGDAKTSVEDLSRELREL